MELQVNIIPSSPEREEKEQIKQEWKERLLLSFEGLENLSLARKIVDEEISSPQYKSSAYRELATALARAGEDASGAFQLAQETIQEISDPRERSLAYQKLATAFAQAGAFQLAQETAQEIFDSRERLLAYRELATALARAGEDASGAFQLAQEAIQKIFDSREISLAYQKLATALAQAGAFQLAQEAIQKISHPRERSLAYRELAVAQLQASHFKERNTIPPDILRELVVSGNAQVTLSAGVLYPELLEDTIFLKTLPPAIRASLGLGKALLKKSSSDIQTRQSYSQELSTLAFSGDGRLFERAVARGLVLHSYEDASSILLQRLKDNKDPRESIRLLKTLIEIDNPKGRAMATQFFTHKELPESLRMYLLKKLLACGYWDANLIPKLEENEKEGKREQTDAILCALITRLGLTPDLAVFNALESPGILKGETLQDRVSELLSLRTQFSELPLQELREMLKDEDKRKIFYMVKGGEYKYTLINDYSFEKFSLVLSKINEESLDERAPDRFQKSLARAKKTAKEQKHIIEAFLAGRVPLVDPNQRVFSFDSRVDLGSEYELAMNRLQEIWNNELRALILAGNRESIPAGLGDALRDTEEREPTTKKQKISLGFLEVGGKKDYQALCELAQKVKKELESRAQKFPDKQRKRIRLNEIEGYNIQRLFTQYLQVQLPKLKDTFLLSEWESHLAEILPKLQAGRVEGRSVDKSFELTFLDKAKDFVRSLRFADGQQCCFNSKNYDIQDGMGSSDWIAKLNADPLSFLIDLKEKDSRIIAGFVFGRMGIDPKSKKPIVMINGIYSQEGGGAIESNILKIIEEQFAGKIGACKVVIASKHGGTLTKIPQGYTKVENLSIEAIRALTDNDKVYDDIGDVANGEFQFSGYYKDL